MTREEIISATIAVLDRWHDRNRERKAAEIADVIRALAKPGADAPEGWRDIASAPRDGTHILVTEAHLGGLGACGPLNEHGFRDPADWCDVVHWFDDPAEPGFYSTSWGGDQEHPFAGLTHWMPLPPPPSQPKEGER